MRRAAKAERGFNPRSPCGERRQTDMWGFSSNGFNPRSPCGERRVAPVPFAAWAGFNPRSPCGERRGQTDVNELAKMFQPTLPLRGATPENGRVVRRSRVSTHAPLAGSDGWPRCESSNPPGFNPRSPCGERRVPLDTGRGKQLVSTHAPLAGSDCYILLM